MTICENDSCTGCYACQNVCPHNAIQLLPARYGYIHPHIDNEKCVECGLCKKVCPINAHTSKNTPISAHITRAKDEGIVETSSSGGIMSVFIQFIMNSGGVVYGCTGHDGTNIRHIRIDNIVDSRQLRGSKYVQSHIEYIYRQVKHDIDADRKVLFIGTPCQNAALRNYLHKECHNLICIDFICHGVPSHEILARHIEEQTGLKPEQTGEIIFRSRNKKGHSIYGVTVYDRNGKCCYSKKYPNDEYITAFIHGLTYRESCYQCLYATPQRVSDITLGDYWDTEHQYGIEGLSMLIVNTDKGNRLLESVSDDIRFLDISTTVAFAERNQQLKEPIRRHPMRDAFLQWYDNDTFNHAAHKALRNSYRAMRNKRIKHILSSIPGFNILYNAIKNR